MKYNTMAGIILVIMISCFYHTCRAVEAISITLQFDYSSYLEYEDVPAKVTIHNKKNLPLIIDVEDKDNKNRLSFIIKRFPDTIIKQVSPEPIVKNLLILPDERITTSIDISRWYPVNFSGRYMVIAVLEYAGQRWESNAMMIDIVPGMEIITQTRELAYSDGQSRKYSLRYWPRKGREYLFLRVEDIAEQSSATVFNLGPLVRVTTPTIEVDRKGNVIVWHQQDTLCFVRTILRSTLDELTLQKQTFHLKDGRPYPLSPSR